MKKVVVSIILGGLLFLASCGPNPQESADAATAGAAQDLSSTQTAMAATTDYLQQMAVATESANIEQMNATQTALAFNAPTPTLSATDTPEATSDAVVSEESISVRSGPGTVYAIQSYAVRGDQLTILGQANNCAWLYVRTAAGKTGWVSGPHVTYHMACSDIAQAPVPPPPTAVAKAQATQAQSGSGSSSCNASDTILINNTTNTGLNVILTGPATFSVHLISGQQTTVSVCPGSYTWTAYGCGGSGTGTGTVGSGGSLELFCSH